jgi:hypothetical protein
MSDIVTGMPAAVGYINGQRCNTTGYGYSGGHGGGHGNPGQGHGNN